ncbi:hypothetical protein ACFLS9_10675 [Bacteroidota bacterium]
MRTALIGCMFIFVFVLGCDTGDIANTSESDNPSISAKISWTQDVTNINMIEVGVEKSKISQNSIHELRIGKGTIYWISAGIEFSKTIDVGNVEGESDDDIECEQEGEYEGENEGCLFSFTFSGDGLTISK